MLINSYDFTLSETGSLWTPNGCFRYTHLYCARCREKGKDTEPCIKNEDCQHCNVLTEVHKSCLATPSYQKNKEKHEQTAISEESSSTLVDLALVSVLGVAKDRQDLNSEDVSSTPVAKAKKNMISEELSSKNVKDRKTQRMPESIKYKSKSVKKHMSPAKVSKPSTDSKLEAIDQKWSERFSRLEAMLLSKTFNQPEPVFQSVIVSSQASTSRCC